MIYEILLGNEDDPNMTKLIDCPNLDILKIVLQRIGKIPLDIIELAKDKESLANGYDIFRLCYGLETRNNLPSDLFKIDALIDIDGNISGTLENETKQEYKRYISF